MRLTIDDHEVYVYTGGREPVPGQPVIVFIHGAQLDHSCWALQSRYFAHHGFNVLAVDLPAHGRSSGPALTNVEAMGEWIERVVPAACPSAAKDGVLLVGHSMGSLIALEAAAQLQECVKGVALLGTAAPMTVSEALLNATRETPARAMEMINQWSHSGVTHLPGSPGPGFSVYIQNLRLMQRQPPELLFTDFNACNAYQFAVDRAQALECPTLVIMGDRDQMTPPKAARSIITALKWPRSVTLHGAGHALMTEQPDGVLDAMREWVKGLEL